MKFYSHGKLLITGEYLVIKGATSLSVPTLFGQSLEIKKSGIKNHLIWESYEYDKLWFKCNINTELFEIVETSNPETAKKLLEIVRQAGKLNPDFLTKLSSGNTAKSKIDFNLQWGLGSSSGLLSNIAFWAGVNPFRLLKITSRGSGYDVVVAREKGPVFFRLKNSEYELERVDFNPPFSKQIYFIYLGKKQNSGRSVDEFLSKKKSFKYEISLVSDLSRHIAKAKMLEDFEYYIKEHEVVLSSVLKQERIKEARFNDLDGEIKSLGAWGGDFAMLTWRNSKQELLNYLKQKGIDIVFSFNEMVSYS